MTVDLSFRTTPSRSISFPQAYQIRFASAALNENPETLAEGGTLAFGLRHVYPIKNDFNHVHKTLKGSDAVVYQSVLALGYEPCCTCTTIQEAS
jgi:hypothetical protein